MHGATDQNKTACCVKRRLAKRLIFHAMLRDATRTNDRTDGRLTTGVRFVFRTNQGRERSVRPQAPPRPPRGGGISPVAGADVRRRAQGGAARRAPATHRGRGAHAPAEALAQGRAALRAPARGTVDPAPDESQDVGEKWRHQHR